MSQNKERPIGVFDSGLGGLTVFRALKRSLPYEDLVYFGDTARVPYGTKSPESIIRFSRENAALLLKERVKLIVVACNTSSSYALPALQKELPVPVVGVIEPGVNKAVVVTRNRKIGLIATSATVNSGAYERAIRRADRLVKVTSRDCPLFVPLVEAGWTQKDVTYRVAREYLGKIKSADVDTLILGCTHYPLLKPVLRRVLGRRVYLVDSAQEVADEVCAALTHLKLLRERPRRAKYRFLVSDAPKHFQKMARGFLGYPVRVAERARVGPHV